MVETTVHLKDYNNYHQALKIDVLLLVAPKMGFLEQLHWGMICLSAGLLFYLFITSPKTSSTFNTVTI
jgi:hypothetical protein